MEGLAPIIGWALYILVALYAFSGLLGIARAASTGGSVTQIGLAQWAITVVSLMVFGFGQWSKLHLLWVIPVGFIASFTPIGRALGYVVGIISEMFFGGRN